MDFVKKPWALALLIILLGSAFYWSALTFDVVNLDDPNVLIENPAIRNFEIQKVLTEPIAGLYHPLTSLTYTLDWKLGGGHPFYFHLTNLLLHFASSFLVFLICQQLLNFPLFSLLSCLIFLLHPLKIESVVWITERKDTLSGFFALLSIWFYLSNKKTHLLYAFLFLFAALLAKISMIILPVLFLLFDWYRQKKIDLKNLASKGALLALSIPIFYFNVKYQVSYGMESNFNLEGLFRLPTQMFFYLEKFLFPWHLRPIYLTQNIQFNLWSFSSLVLFAIAAVYSVRKSTQRDCKFGWAMFFIFIFPYLKLLKYGDENIVNDRYMYLSSLGLCFALLPDFLRWLQGLKNKPQQKIFAAIAIALPLSWIPQFYRQIPMWKDSLVFWRSILELEPESRKAAGNLGKFYLLQGKYEMAAEQLARAEGSPKDVANLGYAWNYIGQKDRARALLIDANQEIPADVDLRAMLGLFQLEDGNLDQAEKNLIQAESLFEKKTGAVVKSQIFMHRGLIELRRNQLQRAEEFMQRALREVDFDSKIYYNLGLIQLKQERLDEAEKNFKRSIELNENQAAAMTDLGTLYFRRGQLLEAKKHYEMAMAADSKYELAQKNLQAVLLEISKAQQNQK